LQSYYNIRDFLEHYVLYKFMFYLLTYLLNMVYRFVQPEQQKKQHSSMKITTDILITGSK